MEAGYFVRSIEFIQDYRCFAQGDQIEFHPGVNLLVGDQGCGKSTVLNLLAMRDGWWKETIKINADPVETKHFDFEKDNNRTQRGFQEHLPTMLQIQMQRSSHGEVNRGILGTIHRMSDIVLLMDEPDQAMSLRSIFAMDEVFKQAVDRGCQVIISVHNPKLIELQDRVYDLEQRAWVTSEEFIEAQHHPREKGLRQFGLGGE